MQSSPGNAMSGLGLAFDSRARAGTQNNLLQWTGLLYRRGALLNMGVLITVFDRETCITDQPFGQAV